MHVYMYTHIYIHPIGSVSLENTDTPAKNNTIHLCTYNLIGAPNEQLVLQRYTFHMKYTQVYVCEVEGWRSPKSCSQLCLGPDISGFMI